MITYKWFLSLLVTIGFYFSGVSQKEAVDIEKRTDSILQLKPSTYKKIDKILKPFQRDSLKVKILIEKFNVSNYNDGLAYEYIKLGNIYRKYSEYDKAILFHEKALTSAKKGKNIEFEIFSLNMLGVDYRRKNLYTSAINYNKEALVLADRIENPNSGILRSMEVSHNSIGNIYLLLEQYTLAEKSFRKALEIAEKSKNKWSTSINNENIAKIKEAQDSLNIAIAYTKKALAIDESINNHYGRMICYNRLARLHIKKGNYNTAISYLDNAVPIAKSAKNLYYTSLINSNLGLVNAKKNNFSKAKEYFKTSLEIAEKKDYKTALVEIYTNYSEYNELIGNYKEALKYQKKQTTITSQLQNSKTTKYVNDLIAKYDSERKTSQIKDLAKQNEITQLKLSKNKTYIIISLIFLLLIASLLYFFYRQNALNKEKRILTLEQDFLRSQMNPHFLFNALNSIKHYIISNEQKSAIHYLNKFSKLIRKTLESSTVKEVSLEEELSIMDLYLNIENIRFSNEIDFQFKVDEEHLDIAKIKVPPLVLQPFLENALWHGLSSKKGDKKIDVEVSKELEDFVSIKITDNGIGREQSALIKKNKLIKRKSVGLHLTKERLNNFVRSYKNTFSLNFIDLKDVNNLAVGTKVILKLPTK